MNKWISHLSLITLMLLTSGIPATHGAPANDPVEKKQLNPTQTQMLDLAFSAASAIPVDADLTDRSKAQESVLSAAIELQQPQYALNHIDEIEDWRQGAVYADLALHYAKNNSPDSMDQCLKKAIDIAETADDWRRDRIRVKLAQVHAYLGNHEQANALQEGVEKGDQGKVISTADFDKKIEKLNRLIAQNNFDILKNAANSAADLYEEVYPDPAKRDVVEKLIESASKDLPPFIRINLLTTLAQSAFDHNDPAHAKNLLLPARDLFSTNKWTLEDLIPLKVTLATQLFKLGEKDKSLKDISDCLALFDSDKSQILSSKRATTLIQIAEAYVEMGEGAQAMAIYKKAIAQGDENPNGRPRALDLSSACRSIALHPIKPDDELITQIKRSLNSLKAPW